MSDGQQQEVATLPFEGHQPRRCGEHRTVGSHRAWCYNDGEWCYPESPCPGCQQPVGVCVICASNVYHDGGHFPEAAEHNYAGYNCVAPKPQVVGNYIGDPYCPVCPPRSNAASVSTQAATPPLVAAPPVPPVVPDSDPQPPFFFMGHDYSTCELEDGLGRCGCAERASGSGVVPDKPALADERRCDCYPDPRDHEAWCPKANASVPAVTDDEAATAENALAARLHQVCRFPAHKGPQVYRDCFVLAREALTALRSAGFLIVHHTKET